MSDKKKISTKDRALFSAALSYLLLSYDCEVVVKHLEGAVAEIKGKDNEAG